MSRLTSRKFILSVLTLASATWLCWGGYIFEGVYSAVVIAVCGAYMTANVFQRSVETKEQS